MRINKESCRQALEVMLETYTVWNDASEKASLLPVIAVLAIGAGQDGLDVPTDGAWDEQISLTPEGEAALLADVVEGSGLPAPFDGPEWAGWQVEPVMAEVGVCRTRKSGNRVVVCFGKQWGYQVLCVREGEWFFGNNEQAHSKAEELAKTAGGWA